MPGPTTEAFTLDAGQVRLLQNDIPIPRVPSQRLYDGRDRITIIGQPIAVVRAGWLTSPGSRLAGAWEVPRVSTWGQRYVLPISEDLGRGGTLPAGDFDYVSFGVMAAYDGTVVQVDTDANGSYERTETINAGQTLFVRGSVDPNVVSIHSGAHINASLPAVVLAEFRATRRAGGVLIEWRTVAEQDNYGFRVYRSDTPSRDGAVPITPNIIPAQGRGRVGGASYSFYDTGAPDGPLYYWLEDIDLNGVSTFHGPATPSVEAAQFTLFVPLVPR